MINKHTIEKSIIFISFHFPPDAKVGAKRIAKLAGFLKEKGFKVSILTVKDKYYDIHDDSLCNNSLNIYRTSMFPSIRLMYIGIKKLICRLTGRNACEINSTTSDSEMTDNYILASTNDGKSSGFLGWIRRMILSFIWLPDDKHGWVPFGFIKCLTLFKKHRIIYSSSPPHSVHLIPLLTSFLFKNNIWVAEFRDPWIAETKPLFVRTRLSDWLENLWISTILKRCARVIVVTAAMKNDLVTKYPQYERKIKIYYNGYDENEFAPIMISERKESQKIIFAHAGAFYHGRDPKIFMTAVSELISDGKINKNDIQINFIGDSHIGASDSIEDYAELLNISELTKCYGYVPNKICLGELHKADVLLLFSVEQPQQVPAKFYEYLALKKSILSITTGGMTSELIDKTGSGINVHPNDVKEIKEAILKMFSGQLPERNETEIRKFNIYSIYTGLSEDLNDLTEQQ